MAENFEVNDFTTVSDWERFFFDLDDLVNNWKLNGAPKEMSSCFKASDAGASLEWAAQSEQLKIPKGRIALTLQSDTSGSCHSTSDQHTKQRLGKGQDFYMMAASASGGTEFSVSGIVVTAPFLARCFAIREFVVAKLHLDTYATNTDAIQNSVLSCFNAVQIASGCEVPFFIQHGSGDSLFTGCQNSDFLIIFETSKWLPRNMRCLSGLVALFKEKMGQDAVSVPVKASIRLTYLLEEPFHSHWSHLPPDSVAILDGTFEKSSWDTLSCGTYEDSLKEFYLYTFWVNVNEDMFVENENYSDLDAVMAPFWSIRVVFYENIQFLLVEKLRVFVNFLACRDRCCSETFSRLHSEELQSETRTRKRFSPLELNDALQFLFPDTDFSDSFPNPKTTEAPSGTCSFEEDNNLFASKLNRSVKSAPLNSLSWRVACVLLNVATSVQGSDGIACMWQSFVEQLRYRFEAGLLLPGVENCSPQFDKCLLHQKLQMLNCCIRHKIRHELNTIPEFSFARDSPIESNAEDETDVEFFDAEEDSDALRPPEGRRAPLENLVLLNRPAERLYVPETQDPSPLTEDMLEEQSALLTQLGESLAASSLRARIQSASLLSDISAFKAANPGCCFEDFIRWYSPKDWETDSNGQGRISDRMQFPKPDNIWLEAWDNALACPAQKQKLLFDYNKEAEKIIHWMLTLTIGDVVSLVMPVVLVACFRHLVQEITKLGPEFKENVSAVLSELEERICADSQLSHERLSSSKFSSVLNMVEYVERALTNFKSLKARFVAILLKSLIQLPDAELNLFILSSMDGVEVALLGGSTTPVGMALKQLFFGDQNSDSSTACVRPVEREYILRAKCSRPSRHSRAAPQRLYAVLNERQEKFSVFTAFAEDKLFF